MTVPGDDPSPRVQTLLRVVRAVFVVVFVAFFVIVAYLLYLLVRG